jgi:hypothetical protein
VSCINERLRYAALLYDDRREIWAPRVLPSVIIWGNEFSTPRKQFHTKISGLFRDLCHESSTTISKTSSDSHKRFLLFSSMSYRPPLESRFKLSYQCLYRSLEGLLACSGRLRLSYARTVPFIPRPKGGARMEVGRYMLICTFEVSSLLYLPSARCFIFSLQGSESAPKFSSARRLFARYSPQEICLGTA